MKFSDHQDRPYTFWQYVREQKGLLFSHEFSQQGAWLVSRYADCEQVLKDTRHFSVQRTGAWIQDRDSSTNHDTAETGTDATQPQQARSLQTARSLFARALLFTDAPAHTQLRRIMQPLFKPAALRLLSSSIREWTQAGIDTLCAEMAHNGTADFVQHLAQPLPAKVIARLIGIEDALYPNGSAGALTDRFRRWSSHLANFIGAPCATPHQIKAAQLSIADMADFFSRLCNAQQYSADGMLASLVQAEQQGSICRDTLLAQAVMMLFAGHETTRNLLSNGLFALLQHREQWERLCHTPHELAASCTRELLRWDTPIQYTGRRVTQNCTLAGQALKRNDVLILALASANHDTGVFTGADTLDITRQQAKPLSFGLGTHHCIGALLTEMETQTVLSMLAEQLPELQLAGHQRSTSAPAYRGMDSLLVSMP